MVQGVSKINQKQPEDSDDSCAILEPSAMSLIVIQWQPKSQFWPD